VTRGYRYLVYRGLVDVIDKGGVLEQGFGSQVYVARMGGRGCGGLGDLLGMFGNVSVFVM
jgi:hypothetical protein